MVVVHVVDVEIAYGRTNDGLVFSIGLELDKVQVELLGLLHVMGQLVRAKDGIGNDTVLEKGA